MLMIYFFPTKLGLLQNLYIVEQLHGLPEQSPGTILHPLADIKI